jgi:thiol:disulfide interchange protein
MPLRALFLRIALFLGLLAPAAHAQVQASLIAAEESIQPGRPFTVALRLDHESHWHSYWINPGTGYPTSLTWKLPAGWTASPIQWPTPEVTRDTTGTITGNGYSGVIYLPVTITPPADLKPGETVTLAAEAKWLMCAEVCVPGKADVSLALPVRTEAPAPDATHGQAIATALAQLPQAISELTATATLTGKTITLRLSAPAGVKLPALNKPWFFSTDKTIQFDEPQTTATPAPGELLALVLPVSPYLNAAPTHLTGVLRIEGGPVTGITIDTPITAASGLSTLNPQLSTPPASAPLAGTLLLAFIGGLILNLMPCVFPVLGIKILGFVNQAGANRRKVTLHGLTFAVGVLASFWALAGVLAVLRAGGDQLGWGFQLQSPAFVFTLAAVMLVFALSMSGVFEFGLRATAVGSGLQSKDGLAGSFFTGVLATVVATPCSAPFLAPALGAALALPVIESFAVFTAIAVGLALPYLLLSLFPQAVKALPRPGAWMETFKQAMAFPLYATVGYLVWVLAGQLKSNDTALLGVLLGLTAIAAATWLYGRYATFGASPTRTRIGVLGGILLLALGAWLGWPRHAAPTDIIWQPWSAEAVAKAVADGKPVYVDFTARWCFTCQTNKKVVFGSDEVLKNFREKSVVTLRADWTDEDPKITAELAKWNRSAVPFNLIYLPGKPTPVILPELLTPGVVLDAINQTR